MTARNSFRLILFPVLFSLLFFPHNIPAQESTEESQGLDKKTVHEEESSKEFTGILTDEELEKEFPLWARDLRRAEIVAFGSLPFTLFVSRIGVDTWRWSQNAWDMQYAPWPLKGTSSVDMSSDEVRASIAIAFGISTLIAIADHLVLRHNRSKAREQALQRPRSTLQIEKLDNQDNTETKVEGEVFRAP